jgi:RNA recognition motif-containing protein
MDIFVGNLAFTATDDDLKELFEEHGQVNSARVILDRETGRSRGFGFVEMPNRTEAENAIESTNGADFQGRPLRVNESQPREARPPRRDRGDMGGGGGAAGARRPRRFE